MLKRRGPKKILENAVFKALEHAVLIVTGSVGEVFVINKLYDHANHVFVWQKLKKLTGKTMMPNCIIATVSLMNIAPTFYLL